MNASIVSSRPPLPSWCALHELSVTRSQALAAALEVWLDEQGNGSVRSVILRSEAAWGRGGFLVVAQTVSYRGTGDHKNARGMNIVLFWQ